MDLAYGALVVLVLLLAGVAALGRRMAGYYSDSVALRFPRALASGVDFAPGDIVLFVAATHGFSNSAVTRSFFSHAAFVVQDPRSGRLYLSESAPGEVLPVGRAEYAVPGGARLLPLYARLKHYTGAMYHMRLAPALAPAGAARAWERAQRAAPYPGLLQSLAGLLHLPRSARGGARHCMEHVAQLVDAAGLTPAALLARGQRLGGAGFVAACQAVTRLAGRPLGPAGAHAYAPPVQVLYDLDCPGPAPAGGLPRPRA